MTKSQTEALANNLVDANLAIKNLDVTTLEGMDWQARQLSARRFAEHETPAGLKYGEAFITRYIDRTTSLWGSKLKQLENARRAFKNALTGLTVEQAHEQVANLAKSFNFRGSKVENSGLEIMRGERGYRGDGASLRWEFKRNDGETVNPDDAGQRVYSYRLELTISTCGTTYTPARMALVNKIQSELLEAAAEIEATMSHERVQSTWGVPVVDVQASEQVTL